MFSERWIKNHTESLRGKIVAITGSTGGIGIEVCNYLGGLGASLILLDRDMKRSRANRERLLSRYPDIDVRCITVDLEDMASVVDATLELSSLDVDFFIHNAGAYCIERHRCTTGYDNLFQINFASPYYMIRELIPCLKKRGGRAIVVGSIAHNYSKIDEGDVDFLKRKAHSKAYGNAKRYLMYSVSELFFGKEGVSAAIVHPGITFTNITAHYPKLIFAIIKHPMKVIFMKPKTAALCVIAGIFESFGYSEWIGPAIFDIWGLPKKRRLLSASSDERKKIFDIAETVYKRCKESVGNR